MAITPQEVKARTKTEPQSQQEANLHAHVLNRPVVSGKNE
jgi:hypothetical protein